MRSNQQGFTLIEMMISLAISAFVLAGVFGVFIANKRSYESQNLIMDAQQNARFALDLIARDVRNAGFMLGVCNDTYGGDVDDCIDSDVLYEGAPYNGGLSGPVSSINGGASGSDSITLAAIVPFEPPVILVEGQPADQAANFKVNDNAPIIANGLECLPVLAVNAAHDHAILFIPTNLSGGGATVVHNSGGSCAGTTGYANDQGKINGELGPGSELVQFSSVRYFITTVDGQPCLVRSVNGAAAQTMSRNIEDLQIAYGFDNGGVLTYYNDIASSPQDLRFLRMVRITLIARTGRNDPMGLSGGRPAVEDRTAGSADNQHRRVYSTTVKVRNFGLSG